jgi:hypothetical protein
MAEASGSTTGFLASASTTVKKPGQSTTVNVPGSSNDASPYSAVPAEPVESIELGPNVSLTIANDYLNVLGKTTACPG